jgi:hypothetical protein
MSLLDPAPSGSEGSNRDAGDGADPTPDGLADCRWRARRSAKAPRLAGEARVSLGGEVCPAPCRRSVETLPKALVPGNSLKRGRGPR